MLIYAKGGYTNAKVKASYEDADLLVTGSDELEGYRLGAGLQPDRHQVAAMIGYRF